MHEGPHIGHMVYAFNATESQLLLSLLFKYTLSVCTCSEFSFHATITYKSIFQWRNLIHLILGNKSYTKNVHLYMLFDLYAGSSINPSTEATEQAKSSKLSMSLNDNNNNNIDGNDEKIEFVLPHVAIVLCCLCGYDEGW